MKVASEGTQAGGLCDRGISLLRSVTERAVRES